MCSTMRLNSWNRVVTAVVPSCNYCHLNLIKCWWWTVGLDVFIKYLIHHPLNSLEIMYWMKERQRWGLFSLEEGHRQREGSSCCSPLFLGGSRDDGAMLFLEKQSVRTRGKKHKQAAATEILIWSQGKYLSW